MPQQRVLASRAQEQDKESVLGGSVEPIPVPQIRETVNRLKGAPGRALGKSARRMIGGEVVRGSIESTYRELAKGARPYKDFSRANRVVR